MNEKPERELVNASLRQRDDHPPSFVLLTIFQYERLSDGREVIQVYHVDGPISHFRGIDLRTDLQRQLLDELPAITRAGVEAQQRAEAAQVEVRRFQDEYAAKSRELGRQEGKQLAHPLVTALDRLKVHRRLSSKERSELAQLITDFFRA